MDNIDTLWKYDVSDDIGMGNIGNLQREYEKGWNVNEPIAKYAHGGRCVYPVILAIQKKNMLSLQFLLEHGSKLDFGYEHAFLYALKNTLLHSDESMIRYVVSKKAKVKVYDTVLNAYDYIAQYKKMEYIPLVMELGVPINPYAGEAILSEISNSNYEVIEAFISNGFDINYHEKTQRNGMENSPLCMGAIYCDEKMIKYLIKHGADPLITDRFGRRPYLLAVIMGNLKNAELLREYEPNKGQPDEKVVENLPSDLRNFLEKGKLRLDILDLVGIEYVEFLSMADLTDINFNGEAGILLTKELDNYPGIDLLWNTKKKCVSYFEEEHGWYGDFEVSFQTFLEKPARYIKGIFSDEFVV